MSDATLKIDIKFDGSNEIKGDNGTINISHGHMIQRFQVDQKIGLPDYFSIELAMWDFNEFALLDSVKPGTEVEILVGYDDNHGVIFTGEVSYCEPHFGEKLRMTVSGYDVSHRLTRGTSSRTFGDGHAVTENLGSVLGSLVGDSGAEGASDGLSADAAQTETELPYLAQYNSNLYQMVSSIAGPFGLDWNSGPRAKGKLSLKPFEKGEPVLVINRESGTFQKKNDNVLGIDVELRCSTVKQVSQVVVRGWDSFSKKPIKGIANSVATVIGGTPGFEQANKAHTGSTSAGRVLEITDIPVSSLGEANEVASGILEKLAMDWMTGTVEIEGNPLVHAGDIVELKGFGKRYSGEYLVEGCQHVHQAGSSTGYRTILSVARNGSPEVD